MHLSEPIADVLDDLVNLTYNGWSFYTGRAGHRFYIQPFRFADDGTGQQQTQIGSKWVIPNDMLAAEVYDAAIELARIAGESHEPETKADRG